MEINEPGTAVRGAMEFFDVTGERDLVDGLAAMSATDRGLIADVFGFEGAKLGTAREIVERYGFTDSAAVDQRLLSLKAQLRRAGATHARA